MFKNIFPLFTLFIFQVATAQLIYEGPNDPAGDPSNIRDARMDGNRILLYFKNTTQLSNWEPGGLSDVSMQTIFVMMIVDFFLYETADHSYCAQRLLLPERTF